MAAALKQNVVNLDALIPRADLAEGVNSDNVKGVTLNTLEPGTLVYKQLRKPDFQRETANWRPEQVAQLIITFLTKDLVPAIVLWEAGPRVFVIDGAHRLSALIAWVHDDYGDGDISRGFFHGVISRAQKIAADNTRALVDAAVGAYADHKAENPATPEIASRAKLIAWQEIQAQWIKNADARSAENSFFRINQGGTTIDATESRILNARGTATAISARAILRGGTGNEYWRPFDEPTRIQIQQLGAEVHSLLFAPDYDLPIKTLNLPLAGFGYGSAVLPFVFDLVNLANDVPVPDSSHKNAPKEETGYEADPDGKLTIRYLHKVRESLWRVCSTHPSSLGLLPALYFYSGSGGFQPNSLLTIITLFKGWSTDDFKKFTDVRKTLEDFLLSNRKTTEAIRKLGSGSRSRPRLVSLYRRIIKEAKLGKTVDEIKDLLSKEKDFAFLAEVAPELDLPAGKFNRDVKGTAFLNTALPNALRCPSCNGLLHNLAMHVGHKKHRRDGGSGAVENAHMQHPFCNSTYDQ